MMFNCSYLYCSETDFLRAGGEDGGFRWLDFFGSGCTGYVPTEGLTL